MHFKQEFFPHNYKIVEIIHFQPCVGDRKDRWGKCLSISS